LFLKKYQKEENKMSSMLGEGEMKRSHMHGDRENITNRENKEIENGKMYKKKKAKKLSFFSRMDSFLAH